ncbi:cell wall hydrolase [Thiorhodococcus fuscus]|uniref:Cell wall hydrolase n=1 Tax=Thiorhodococcus fuscus TaxID=527200 RepID=A0ABW4YDZ2_9GAMM
MQVLTFAALPALIFPSLLASSSIEHREPEVVAAIPVIEDVESTADEGVEPVAALSKEDADLRCLALNIYHEARSEPEAGQIAVARVTLNRVGSKAFPGSICAVVKQGGTKRNRCQFSWWCDGRSDRPKNARAWRRAMDIARKVLDDAVPDPTRGALYYHASYCKPSWSSAYRRTTRIGSHLFYRPIAI